MNTALPAPPIAFVLALTACHPLQIFETATEFSHPAAEQAYPGRAPDYHGMTEIAYPGGATFEVPFVSIDGEAIAGGDILLGRSDALSERSAAVTLSFSIWPHCSVPYELDPSLTATSRQDFLDAAAYWTETTGVHFVEAPLTPQHIVVQDGPGCSSALGRTAGNQPMVLASNCGRGAAIHEIGHAVGLFHEQSRSDSEDHVIKHWDNIPPEWAYAFQSYVERGLGGSDRGPYDFRSIMHYQSGNFSTEACTPTQPGGCTLTHLDGSYISEAQRQVLSEGDIATIAQLYPCAGSTPHAFLDNDDHGNGFTNATELQIPETRVVFGDLNYPDDRDVFHLTAEEEGPFTISTIGGSDTFGTLFDAAGNELASDSDSAFEGNFRIEHSGSIGEQYYLEVRGQSPADLGEFVVRVQAGPLVDTGAPPISPNEVDLDATEGPATTTLSATLQAAGAEVYTIHLTSAGPVQFTATTLGSTDTVGTLMLGDGTELDTNDDAQDLNFEVSALVEHAGVLLVTVQGYSDTTEGDFDLVLTAVP